MKDDALLSELTANGDGDFDNNFFLGLFALGARIVCVDGLAWVALQVMHRISPPPPPVESHSSQSTMGADDLHDR